MQLKTPGFERRNCVTVRPANCANDAQVSPSRAAREWVQADWARAPVWPRRRRASARARVGETMVMLVE